MMYREGQDPDEPVEAPTASPEEPSSDAPSKEEPGDAIDVAFVVFRTKSGVVYPAHHDMSRFGLATERDVHPNEMYRMCLDLADQLSSVRVVGEVLKGVRAMIDAQGAHAPGENVSRKLSDVPE